MSEELEKTIQEGWRLFHQDLGLNREDALFRGQMEGLSQYPKVSSHSYGPDSRTCNLYLSERLSDDEIRDLLRGYFGDYKGDNFHSDFSWHSTFTYERGTSEDKREFVVKVHQPSEGEPTK